MASKTGRIDLPFAGGFYAARSRQFSNQRCINWYPNYAQSDALNEYCLYPTPGVEQLFGVAAGDGPSRGAHVMNGVPYLLCGNTLYRIDRVLDGVGNETLSRVPVAQISGSSRVRMASTKNQLCIVVPGESAWIYAEGASHANQIIDPDFDGPVDDVVQLDSVFVFCKTGTNKVFHSDLNDGNSYRALDYTFVNQITVARGLMVYRNQLYVMGDRMTVPYTNIGGTEFLFQVIPSSAIDSGLAAVHAKTNSRGAFVYLGGGQNEELAVWYCQGGNPVKISTDAIDYFLQNFSPDDIARAYMIQHSQSGADFVALTLGGSTIVYDFTASQAAGRSVWHERSSRIPNATGYTDRQWRVASLIQAYNRTLVGDIIDSRIGLIDDDYFTEYGEIVSRTLITQPFINLGARSRVSALELYMGQNPTADTLHDDTQEAPDTFFLTSKPYPLVAEPESIKNQQLTMLSGKLNAVFFRLTSNAYPLVAEPESIKNQQLTMLSGVLRREIARLDASDAENSIQGQQLTMLSGKLRTVRLDLDARDPENSIQGQRLTMLSGKLTSVMRRLDARDSENAITGQQLSMLSGKLTRVVIRMDARDEENSIQGQQLTMLSGKLTRV